MLHFWCKSRLAESVILPSYYIDRSAIWNDLLSSHIIMLDKSDAIVFNCVV